MLDTVLFTATDVKKNKNPTKSVRQFGAAKEFM
jgi:hypothetical protein